MSLVRIPRLWEKRHYYHEWRTFPENRDFSEKDALELFKNYQEEIINQMKNRQNNLAENILDVSNTISDILVGGASSGSLS